LRLHYETKPALTERRMSQPEVYLTVSGAVAAGRRYQDEKRRLRATGIYRAHLRNGGKLEVATADGRARIRADKRSL